MSFATLRRLRFTVLILTTQTWQLHRGMSLEMELMLPELSANSDMSIQNILDQNSIREEELNLVFAA